MEGIDPMTKPTGEYAYDAFASYATDPDRDLVRAVELFVESFHTRPMLVHERFRRPLNLCVDGRDFRLPRKNRAEAEDPEGPIASIVREYQRQSRSLVVFAGPESLTHPWINKEIEWWVDARGTRGLYFALTHGTPDGSRATIMPPALVAAGGGDSTIWFDLRGYYQTQRRRYWPWLPGKRSRFDGIRVEAGRWPSVRPFTEEVFRLVARLHADACGIDFAPNDLVEAWREEDARQRRLTCLKRGALALGGIALAAVAGKAVKDAVDEQNRRTATAWVLDAASNADQPSPALVDALVSAVGAISAEAALPQSRSVLVRAMQMLLPVERTLPHLDGQAAFAATLVADDRLLVTGGRNGRLQFLDLESGEKVGDLDLGAAVRTMTAATSESLLYVGTDSGVRVIRLSTTPRKPEPTIIARTTLTKRIGGIALDEAGGRVYVGDFDGHVWVGAPPAREADWALADLGQVLDDQELPSGAFGLATTRHHVVFAGVDGMLVVFPLGGSPDAPIWRRTHPASIFGMAVSRAGKHIALADQAGGISLYDMATGQMRSIEVSPGRPDGIAAPAGGDRSVWNPPERQAGVSLAFDPTDTWLAVAGHDRTVRFFLAEEGKLAGLLVHNAATRGVVFAQGSPRALSFGDDGLIQIARLDQMVEDRRIAGIGGFAVEPDAPRLIAWTDRRLRASSGDQPAKRTAQGPGSMVYALSTEPPGMEAIGNHSSKVWSGLAAEGQAVLRPSSVFLPVLPAGSCGAGGLQHPNETDNVETATILRAGPRRGTAVTVGATTEDRNRSTIRVWELATCKPSVELRAGTPGEGRIAVNTGTVAFATSPSDVTVWLEGGAERRLAFGRPVEAVGVGPQARMLLVALAGRKEQPSEPVLCRCEFGGADRPTDPACGQHSDGHVCVRAELPVNGEGKPVVPTRIDVSASGQLAVLHRPGGEAAIMDRKSGWNPRPLIPFQATNRSVVYALSRDERLIAIPAPEGGIRILDTDTFDAVAELPTAGPVRGLGFVADSRNRLASLDGGVLRLWDWSRDGLLAKACARWPAHFRPRTNPLLSKPPNRKEVCGPFEAKER